MEYLSFDEKDPNAEFPKAYANAQAKYESSKFKEAIVDLNKAIEIQPKYANSYLLKGMCKAQLKDKNGACVEWRKAKLLGSESATRMLKQYCYKTSPKTKKRKEDNGSQIHVNLSKPITQKDLERYGKYFERQVEYAAEKEKENDQNILFGMLIFIVVFILIFVFVFANR